MRNWRYYRGVRATIFKKLALGSRKLKNNEGRLLSDFNQHRSTPSFLCAGGLRGVCDNFQEIGSEKFVSQEARGLGFSSVAFQTLKMTDRKILYTLLLCSCFAMVFGSTKSGKGLLTQRQQKYLFQNVFRIYFLLFWGKF